MNTLTKEWLQNTITSIESARDEIPFGLDEDQNNMLTALKIALASLASLAAVSDERAAYELFMEKRFGESVDRRRAKNGDREYMAWDMALGWIIWCHRAAMLQGSQPVSQTYNLPELIEGMEVSIDVSTCDADLGNRYFGTVTEALELDTAKNGYILLVQDAEPNFDANGNSPVTPDGWISCSERMPEKYDFDIWVFSPSRGVLDGLQWDGSMFTDDEYQFVIHDATHWMRKAYPAAPQQDGE
ncbi:TPA: DUF551 domain-containing protein [Escherichia coli]|nr:DUF551 domain-containing protein [Escherichia coli]